MTSSTVRTEGTLDRMGPVFASECRMSQPAACACRGIATCSLHTRAPRLRMSTRIGTRSTKLSQPSSRSDEIPAALVKTMIRTSGRWRASAGTRPRRYVSDPPEPCGSRYSALIPTVLSTAPVRDGSQRRQGGSRLSKPAVTLRGEEAGNTEQGDRRQRGGGSEDCVDGSRRDTASAEIQVGA